MSAVGPTGSGVMSDMSPLLGGDTDFLVLADDCRRVVSYRLYHWHACPDRRCDLSMTGTCGAILCSLTNQSRLKPEP
jgi:hypothetical protein